jgi:hypothetical protein
MFKNILFLTLSCALIFSCDDEKEAIPVQYFKVTIDATYSTSQSDDWIVLQDEAGNLLSAKPFETNDVLTFDSVKIISPFSYSVFRYEPAGSFYSLRSYLGIEAGDEMIIQNSIPVFASAPSQGKLQVTVTDNNLGDFFDAALSWKEYFDVPSASSTPTSHIFRERDITSTFNDFFLFVADKNGIPKYKFLENATPGNLNFSLADLSNFDKTVTLALPSPSQNSGAFVQAFDADQPFFSSHGYRVNLYLQGQLGYSRSMYTLGYLNRFTQYLTTARAAYPGYELLYESRGAAPTSNITLSKADVNISNNTQTGFTVTGTDFDWRVSEFTYRSNAGGNISWYVYSDKSQLKNNLLPSQFVSKFSNFNVNLVKHNATRFVKGTTYDDYVLKPMRGEQVLESYTMTTTSIK